MIKHQNKIEKLILELCPNGVKYFSVGEICEINRGRVMSKDYLRENVGEYPVYSSQTANEGIFGYIKTFDYDGEYVTWTTDGANAGSVFYHNGKFSITNVCGLLKPKTSNLNVKYLLYSLSIIAKSYVNAGMGNPKLMSNVMARIKIPVPPLPVQEEIVKILNSFTELEAELEARKKQYEYYRDNVLTFEETIKHLPLGELAGIYDGTHQTPKYINEGVPFVSVENIKSLYTTKKYISLADYDKNYKVKPKIGDVFMTRIGIIGACALVEKNDDLAYYVTLTLIRPDRNKILPNYLRHVIESGIGKKELRKRTLINAVPIKINLGEISKIEIPVPSLIEQERVISVLDKFESLVNDVSIGLPAELNARRQQYEYYRNKLLTFKEYAD